MKIGVDIRCLMHKNYSGVAEYAYNLLDNVFKIDQDNEFILFYNSKKDITDNLPKFDYPNVTFKGFSYPNKLFNLSLNFLHYPKIDQLLNGVDLFFIPNLNFIALSNISKKIITIHDLSFIKFPEFFSLKRRLWHKIIAPEKIINLADKIIADSENTKKDLVNIYKVKKGKITVITLGVNSNIYKKIDNHSQLQNIKNKYNLPENFILYLGTLEPRKNIESIIESFEFLKQNSKFEDLNLVIAGDKGWQFDRIFKFIDKSKYKDQIKYLGYVDKNHKPQLYNLAQLFIFPSFYEGFGLPVLESQACGTPVITSINSSLPEITNNSVFLIKPDNLTEIKNAIELILTNEQLKQKLIIKGFENIDRFIWKKTAEQTLNLFAL